MVEEEKYSELCNDEAVIKLVGKITLDFNEFNNLEKQIKLKEVIEEGLLNYDVMTRCKELITSDINEKIIYYLNVRRLENLSERTIYNYQLILDKFAECFHKPITSITTNDIRMWLAIYKSQDIQASTLNSKIHCLSKFFNFCLNEGYIQVNPMNRIKISKVEKRMKKVMTEEQEELLKNGCETLREKALINFGLSTGCRISEVCNANISSISWQEKSIYIIGKGNKERKVYFSTKTKMLLQEYIKTRQDKDDIDALFVGIKKPYRRLKSRAVQVILDKIKIRAELDNIEYITFHGLRRSCLTNELKHGMKLEQIQRLAGHSSPETTLRYTIITDTDLKHAYEATMA